MVRVLLTNAQWERIAPLPPGKEGDPGRSGADKRLFVEAVLWLVRAGAPWRDLPEAFGKRGSVWKRFRLWALEGVFARIFAALSDDPDFEYALIDGTIVKVHRHGAGAVIPAKSDHKTPIPHDAEMYKWRRLVENLFQRIMEFRRIAP